MTKDINPLDLKPDLHVYVVELETDRGGYRIWCNGVEDMQACAFKWGRSPDVKRITTLHSSEIKEQS